MNDILTQTARQAEALQNGQRLALPMHDLDQLTGLFRGHPAELILGKIIGSGYEYRYWEDLATGALIIERLPFPLPSETGLRGWVESDRQHYYERRLDGLYQLKSDPQPKTIRCPKCHNTGVVEAPISNAGSLRKPIAKSVARIREVCTCAYGKHSTT